MAIVGKLAQTILSNKSKSLNAGFTLWSGIDTYQTEREKGSNIMSSLASAGFDMALTNVLGIGGYLAYTAAKELPSLAFNGYQAYNQYSRQLGLAQRNQAFQNMQYNDTEQVYTMRQAGMEIAKRSRYNTQQAMLGNEAKYMSR